MQEIQLKYLRAIIDYAYRNVRYYRTLFETHGVRPEDIHNIDDLSKIPISTRFDLQNLPREQITSIGTPENEFKKISTSGSSGTPLSIYKTRREEESYDMIWARTFLEDGRSVWDRSADLKFHIPRTRWFESMGVWRKLVISLADETRTQLQKLRAAKPDIIRGNPFELTNLALCAKEFNVTDVNPRLIFTMGSLLDHQSRQLIENIFHSEVFDCYAASEVGVIAWECPAHEGQHVNVDTLVLELVTGTENVGVRERGRVVCTSLYSFGMPFIRYDIGDVAAAREESCSCGRSLPLLQSLEGRADDFFVSKDGRLISPSVIVNEIGAVVGIRQFRFTQEDPARVRAQIVPNNNYSSNTDKEIQTIMKQIMGEELDLIVEKVDVLNRDSSGKTRSLISNVRKQL